MTWIRTIEPARAEGRLATLYQKVGGAGGQVDNILRAHSLRPHTLEGHMALYKSVLHHSGNRLPKALLEGLGVYVSALNGCDYCVEHHSAGLRRLVADKAVSERLIAALVSDRLEPAVEPRERVLYRYAAELTRSPDGIGETTIDALREAGWSDGEILEVNQVVAYFAYANRTVLGLGVSIDGETLGMAPSAGDGDWGHR